jgi:2-phosphoglycerate kinase
VTNITTYTDKNELIEYLKLSKPKIILLSGRTCTGKTTMAKELSSELKMEILNLDDFINENVIKKFDLPTNINNSVIYTKIYSNEDDNIYHQAFIEAFKNFLLENDRPTIIDGSIHNPKIISLFENDFEIIFLHPVDLKSYANRVIKRFEQGVCNGTSGLTERFWDYVSQKQIDDYCVTKNMTKEIVESIKNFSIEIQKKSLERINKIASFSKINVLEI